MKQTAILLLLSLLTVGPIACTETETVTETVGERATSAQIEKIRQDAAKQAEADIKRGHLEVRSFGYPAAATPIYKQLLLEKYNIHINTVSGCVLDEAIVNDAEVYNAISEAEIKKRFGDDVFERTWKEAEKQWKQTNRQLEVAVNPPTPLFRIDVTKADDHKGPYHPLTESEKAYFEKIAKLNAERDIAEGHLILHPFGKRAPSARIYDQLLKEQYGIESSHVVSPTEKNIVYAAAYGDVMRAEIKKRFGDDVFEKTYQESEKIWKSKNRQ